MRTIVSNYINKTTKAAPLAAFRILFGLMMFISIVRFWSYGWIAKLYINPKFHFTYYGFEWVQPLGEFTYLLFFICALSTIGIALGYKYKLAIITFFLSFTYIELMDKTTYLNHYYFISLLSFIMIFLPAGVYFSLDAKNDNTKRFEYIPKWTIDVVKLLLCIVYFYAGLAKLNSEWLVHAMPLKIWLPGKYDLPLIGDLLHKPWIIYAFSWCGALYDLTIPFLLIYKRTRLFAFMLVVVFHVLTRVLFPIGMFPYIMIVSALIFFDASVHQKLLNYLGRLFKASTEKFNNGITLLYKPLTSKVKFGLLSIFFFIQLVFPFRYLAYPGELFWTEEGFRFSWRVMLMEKAGIAQFKVVDSQTGETLHIDNMEHLTVFQEKQMATQPDFILEYAHYLKEHYSTQGKTDPEIYVESYVALNGRRSKPYIDPKVNLAEQRDSFKPKNWLLPFEDEIKGF
ncbi:HTTM domain-containing protein [Fulvivirga lutimaris]|uniref:HTTM domain-containing protein n=1 Tax=Fulvivirga lutimaris TaxID=1819566 RepID=UPI0012BCECCE|nr:HTTM domain-containing protein [Fulvivirga lutimaris]MTI39027.1 HTTM domain-containing protein [Fulvivirga lutimaris]